MTKILFRMSNVIIKQLKAHCGNLSHFQQYYQLLDYFNCSAKK
jgi:hypothetical protein